MKKINVKWLGGVFILIMFNILLFDIVLKRSIDLVEVPVASTRIHARSTIDESAIVMIKVPSAMISDRVIKDKNDIVDHWVKYSVTVAEGSFFYHEYIEEADESIDYPQLMLNDGQGVASLAVDLMISAGNTLLPNQFVDIVFTSKDKRKPIVSDVIFRSVRVLAVKDRNGLNMDDPQSQKVPAVALLAMNKEDIPRFIHAQILGDIDLIIKIVNEHDPDEAICNSDSEVWRMLNE